MNSFQYVFYSRICFQFSKTINFFMHKTETTLLRTLKLMWLIFISLKVNLR